METRRSALTNRSEGESRQLAEFSHFSKLAHALHLLARKLLGHLLHHFELLEQAVDVHDLSAGAGGDAEITTLWPWKDFPAALSISSAK